MKNTGYRTASFSIRRVPFSIALATALTLSLALPGRAAEISEHVKAQISEILTVKSTFSPEEQKMSSTLAFARRKALGLHIGEAANALTPALGKSAFVKVEIRGTIKNGFRQKVRAEGAEILAVNQKHDYLVARTTLESLERLAANPAVTAIRIPKPMRNNVGALTTQGIITHQAKQEFKGSPAYTGAGVKVGVLSDSASQARVNALIASGDLGPNSKVLVPYNDGSGGDLATDEGAAIMEIVQDMAPAATVEFATAYIDFPSAIIALQQDGCTVIVDDIGGPEGVFQDDATAQAVNTVTAAGTIYLSSAGNSGSVAHATAGCWEGDFKSGGTYTPPTGSGSTKAYNIHTFSTGKTSDVLTVPGEPYQFLTWSDPLGNSTNDYDLFVTDSTGTTLKGFSVDTQSTASPGDPEEITASAADGGNYATQTAGDLFIITQVQGAAPRALHFDVERGLLSIFTGGATYGHNAAANAVCIAATFWDSAETGLVPFNGTSNPCETFSSDGPRKIFYTPAGAAITPGNLLFSTNGGTTLQKPDLTAADGVSCTTPGFSPFFGTSAAGPHAAGVAALVISARSVAGKTALTPAQIHTILDGACYDNEAAGVDPTGGNGVLNAPKAVNAALALP